jgi:hypothetical protein
LEDDDKDEFDDDGGFFAHLGLRTLMITVTVNQIRTKKMSLTMMMHILVLTDQMIIVNMNPLRTKKMSLTMMCTSWC